MMFDPTDGDPLDTFKNLTDGAEEQLCFDNATVALHDRRFRAPNRLVEHHAYQ